MKRSGPGALTSVAAVAWDVVRGRAVVLVIFVVLSSLGTPAAGYLSKRMVDALAAGSGSEAFGFAVAFVAVMFGADLWGWAQLMVTLDVGDRISEEFHHRILNAVAGAPGLEHLENQQCAEQLSFVRERSFIPANLVDALTTAGSGTIGLLFTLGLLISIHPTLALVVVLVVPGAWVQVRAGQAASRAAFAAVGPQRLETLYRSLATQAEPAKEIRIFGLADLLIGRHQQAAAEAIRARTRAQLPAAAGHIAASLFQGAAFAAGVVWTIILAARGSVTLGDVAMASVLLRSLVYRLGSTLGRLAGIGGTIDTANRYLSILNYRSPVTVPSIPLPPPDQVRNAIQYQDVSFAYPQIDATVLDGIHVDIPAGVIVAIVGENGAGKTTLVKLLLRYYDPTSGRILIDGRDLKKIDPDEWWNGITASFQDYVKFHLLVRETVGIGDLLHIDDQDAILGAATRAGAAEMLAALPDGIDTQLGREFPGGVELSDGQHQSIALARASMRTKPRILVLDEPTASLDPLAEAAIFRRFKQMTQNADTVRPTVVLVSHRFSTVRMADLIFVLKDGRVIERGSHQQLMQHDGLYAELYRMQAAAYE